MRTLAELWRRKALAWLLAAGLLWLLYLVVRPFFNTLTWAAVLAIFFFPVHRHILRRLPRPNLAAVLSALLVAALLVAPLSWLAPALISQAIQTVRELPREEIAARAQSAAGWLFERIPGEQPSLDEIVKDTVNAVGQRLGQWSALLVANIASGVIDLIVLLLGLFYLFRDGPRLVALLRDVSPFGGMRHDKMVGETIDMISATITAGVVTAVVQGLLTTLAFALLSMPSPILWGVVAAFFSLIPIVGAWMVWLPAAVGLLLNGDYGRGVALLAIGALLVSTVDNFLRPYLIADRSQLNALLVFISVLGGVQAFGFVGLVLGPLVLATAAGLISGYRDSLSQPAGPDGVV